MKVTDLLKKMDIFEGLQEQDLDKVAKLLRERKFGEGAVLFHKGDPGDSMYIILSGRVKLWTNDALGREKVLAFFGEGDFFGETGVLLGEPRTASAEASTATRVLVLRKDDFDQLLAWNVGVMREMLKVVARRQTAANQRLAQEAAAERMGAGSGKVFVLFSPRGGAGKSMLAINLGVDLAEQQPDRVAVLDLDLMFGHGALMLNLTAKSSLAAVSPNALRQLDRDSLNYYLLVHDSSLRLLIGATRPEEGESVTADHVKAVVDAMRRMFSLIIVDTGRTFSEPTLAALEVADQVVMVCTPEPTVLRDLKECQRIFQEVLQLPHERFYWLLNQLSSYKGLSKEELERELGITFGVELPYAGELPSQSALQGVPFVAKNPGAPISKAIERAAKDLQQRALEASVGFSRMRAAQAASKPS